MSLLLSLLKNDRAELLAGPTEAKESPAISYALSGELYASNSGWILLAVPNALVRGLFDAMSEPGVELPPRAGGEEGLKAHISVIRDDELVTLGGANKITERGHHYRYTLGPLRTTEPHGWTEMSRVWMVEIKSPELERLRKSYGLSALPKNNEFAFHITVAVRRRKVLRPGDDVVKHSTDMSSSPFLSGALATQLYNPTWSPGAGLLQNVGNNISEVQNRGVKNVQHAYAAQQMRDSMDGQVGPERLGEQLGGHLPPVVSSPIDKALFAPSLG